jgi:hypothetical protein
LDKWDGEEWVYVAYLGGPMHFDPAFPFDFDLQPGEELELLYTMRDVLYDKELVIYPAPVGEYRIMAEYWAHFEIEDRLAACNFSAYAYFNVQ